MPTPRKYADNIWRVFASAASMLLTMLLSVTLFKETITPHLLLALLIVGTALVRSSALTFIVQVLAGNCLRFVDILKTGMYLLRESSIDYLL